MRPTEEMDTGQLDDWHRSRTRLIPMVCLLLIILLSVALRVFDLAGGRFFELDEYRALSFAIDHTALFRLVYSYIGHLLQEGHQGYLGLSILLSVGSLIPLFLLGRGEMRDNESALIIPAIFALSTSLGWFSRSTYPVTFASFWLCILLFIWHRSWLSDLRERDVLLSLFGVLCAILLLSYVGWYPVILVLLFAGCFFPRDEGKAILAQIARRCFVVAFPFLTAYVAGALVLASIGGSSLPGWFATLYSIQKWSESFVPDQPFVVAVASIGQVLQRDALLLCTLCAAFLFGHNKRVPSFAMLLITLAILSTTLAVVPAAWGLNTLYERNMIGQFVLFLLGGALIAAHVIRDNRGMWRTFPHALLAILVLGCLAQVGLKKRPLLRVHPILDWLASQGSNASEVVTLVDISDHAGAQRAILPHDRPGSARIVNWERFAQLAQARPNLRYLLLTDFYMIRVVGSKETEIWRTVKPVATFSHPETGDTGLRMYDLRTLPQG